MSTLILEELLDMGEKFAHLTLLKLKESQLAPFYHLVTPDDDAPDVLVPCNLDDDVAKENTVAITAALAQVHHAVAVMFVSEAWKNDTMFTVKETCLRGHNIATVGRYKGGQCRQCERARVLKWKRANRGLVLANAKADREAYRRVFGWVRGPYRKRPQAESAPEG